MFLPLNTTSLPQPLDQWIIKCIIEVSYTHFTFRRIPAALDTNLDFSIMDLWKSFTTIDETVLIAEAADALKPKTVNACWKPLWSGVVSDYPLLMQKSGVS